MDELIIEEKRYISSKQAAKLTGYAKDYIGQLCREGRVPARLVGRSWYVLESAIQDHRFGNPVIEEEEKSEDGPISALEAVHEATRYTPSTVEVLPSINQFKASRASDGVESPVTEGDLQDSWRAWFERAWQPEPQVEVSAPKVEAEVVTRAEIAEEEGAESPEVNVPVRAIHHPPLYKPADGEDLPRVAKQYAIREEESALYEPRKGMGRVIRSVQLAGVMISATALVIAVMGTGYFDTYLVSHKQVSLLAGVSEFNR